MPKCLNCRRPFIACVCGASFAVGFAVLSWSHDDCASRPSLHAPFACALPVVDLPHNDTPDMPGPPAAKLVVAAISSATASSTAVYQPISGG